MSSIDRDAKASASLEARVAKLERELARLQQSTDNSSIVALPTEEELPAEVTTKEAAKILGCSKDTVLSYYAAGLLHARDLSTPGSSRPNYRFLRADVIALRQEYVAQIPAPASHRASARRVKKGNPLKHLKLDESRDPV